MQFFETIFQANEIFLRLSNNFQILVKLTENLWKVLDISWYFWKFCDVSWEFSSFLKLHRIFEGLLNFWKLCIFLNYKLMAILKVLFPCIPSTVIVLLFAPLFLHCPSNPVFFVKNSIFFGSAISIPFLVYSSGITKFVSGLQIGVTVCSWCKGDSTSSTHLR